MVHARPIKKHRETLIFKKHGIAALPEPSGIVAARPVMSDVTPRMAGTEGHAVMEGRIRVAPDLVM